MTRRHFAFSCEGDQLIASLDPAVGRTGLLLVSGGNEVRAGAWNGQAQFAALIAAQGFPVLRFDRRGIGDSEGHNAHFRGSAPDITAAITAFRSESPHIDRIFGLGNCDAASALMLSGGAGFDGLILSNPWTIENDSDDAPSEVVRDHYRRRLADPAAIKRLLTGQVSLGKLVKSLASAVRSKPTTPDGLPAQMAQGIAGYKGLVRFLIADRDRTGIAFLSHWDKHDPRIRRCANATHSYVEDDAQAWLVQQVLEMLRT